MKIVKKCYNTVCDGFLGDCFHYGNQDKYSGNPVEATKCWRGQIQGTAQFLKQLTILLLLENNRIDTIKKNIAIFYIDIDILR